MWLTLLELLHRLSIESLFEKVEIRQLPATVPHTHLIQTFNLSIMPFYVFQFYSPILKTWTVHNAEMHKYTTNKCSIIKTLIFKTWLLRRLLTIFSDDMFTKFAIFTTRKETTTSQKPQKGRFWPFSLHRWTLWWRHKMQVLDSIKKSKHKPVSNTHSIRMCKKQH